MCEQNWPQTGLRYDEGKQTMVSFLFMGKISFLETIADQPEVDLFSFFFSFRDEQFWLRYSTFVNCDLPDQEECSCPFQDFKSRARGMPGLAAKSSSAHFAKQFLESK